MAQLINIAVQNAMNAYNQYVDSVTTSFVTRYNEHCLHPLENFIYNYIDKEYHFTLYYYDQAGNLVKTIPPEGVSYLNINSPTSADELKAISDRTYNTKTLFTSHRLATTYEYNSLNQLVRQNMPDHDQMEICENILPNGLDADLVINNVQYVSSNKGYLTGYLTRTIASTPIKRGYVYTTNDAGQNWTRIKGLAGADIQKVQFISATQGFAVANYGMVLKTLDGGNSWDVLTSLYNSTPKYFGTLYDLYFIDATTGIVGGIRAGANGGVYKTTNGGTTFTAATGFAANDTITGLTFDGTNYYASVKNGTKGKFYKSGTGLTWTQQTNIAANMLKKVKYVGNTVAYAVGYDGTLLKSNGANTTWEVIPTASPYKFSDVYFKDATNGIAIVDSVIGLGRIYKTLNGGKTWEALSAPGNYYSSIRMYDASPAKVIASGENGLISKVLMTTPPFGIANVNAGISAVTDDFTFSDAYIQTTPNKLITLGVTNTSRVYFTYDANASSVNWETFNTFITGGFKKGLISISGTTASPTTQALLLNNGNLHTFFRTFGSGSPTYAPVTIVGGGTRYFIDITAKNNNNTGIFYAFDSVSKTIYRVAYATATATTATATQITGAVTQSINSIAMNNNGTRILLVGNIGTIQLAPAMTTTNTSITWTNATNALTPVPLNDIAVTSATIANKVIAVGNDGTMWNTTNGGAQWNMANTNTSTKLNAIKSDVSAIGLVGGNDGQVFAASTLLNTAATLTPISTTITDNFNDVIIDASNKAFAVTKGGKAIYIANYLAPTAVTALATNVNGALNGLAFKPTTTTAYAVGNGTGIINYINASGIILTDVFTQPYYGISFYDNNAGYVVDSGYVIRHTINAGTNWTTVLPIPSTPLITKVAATGINKAVVVGTNNYAAVINGNSSPVAVLVGIAPPTSRYMDISFNQSGQGIIVGTQQVAATISASGSTYIINNIVPPISAPPNFRFNAVHVFNDGGFIACGTKGKIYYHDFSSNTYYQQSLGFGTTETFNDIYFHDDRVGYVVGSAGAAYKCNLIKNIDVNGSEGNTANGITWDSLCPLTIYSGLTPASHNFYAIAFATRTTGFLAGSYSPSTGVFVRHAQVLNDESGLYSTRFWYDKLGRMVISQNTKQFNKLPVGGAYSYTLYDELGRIKEVGEKFENGTATKMRSIFGTNINGLLNLKAIDDVKLLAWVTDITGARKEVTKTYYDNVVISGLPIAQDNLRKRVATVTYEDLFDNVDATYQHATHYSYDIHGNVNVMLQDNPSLAIPTLTISQQYKRIDYDYDLISGKVNKVTYQKAERDEFNHRYAYDADNRITIVETSSEGIVWNVDAKYFYYAHGPLARIEYGNNAVQGMDYAYTLQGWIKGVNSNTLDADRDMGKDGSSLNPSHPNKVFAKDAFGYSLNYYQGDYKQINYLVWNDPLKRFEATTYGSQLQAARYDLFNGNISSMVVTVQDIDTASGGAGLAPKPQPLGSAYKYDQLNRIKSSVAFDNIDIPNNLWKASGQVVANLYANSFTYDANGNILSQNRSDEFGVEFDAMEYKYKRELVGGDLIHNRLYHVRDNTGYSALRSEDIDDEGNFNPNLTNINVNNNYNYDAIGNLTKDSVEQIANIEWTVYGKIKRITRPITSTKDNLVFDYDASGNRIAKHVFDAGNNLKYTTYYVRDAQGNVMGIYDLRIPSVGAVSFKLIEQSLYGSSRIGLNLPDKEMVSTITPRLILHYLGKKQFEMTDHLGNVNSTISDRKIPVESTITPGTISYKIADILSTSGFYPFGMPMPGRSFNSNSYKYGFNGKEKDDEVKGNGNSYDFGARIYDPRIGRWLSVDPQFKQYPHFSPYTAFGDNPIYYIDPEGETLRIAGDETARMKAQVALQKLTNDKVEVMADGLVKITAGNENPGKKLVFGTQLLKGMSASDKTAIISLTTGQNVTRANQENVDSGVPTDSEIAWNPDNTEGGLDVNGSKTRPTEIGLAHEVVHGLLNALGRATDDENLLFGDPDDNGQDSNMGIAELNTRLAENAIRKEQGLAERLVPEGMNRETGEKIDTSKPIEPPPSKPTISMPKKDFKD